MLDLTPHQRDVIARVLNDYADEMDTAAVIQHQAMQTNRHLDLTAESNWQADRAVQSILTSEMRDIAFYVEWGGR